MLHVFSTWIAPTSAPTDYHRRHHALLLLVLAVGTFVRFWGLGNVGLHGDEETMALPAMAILETGVPRMPSGALYVRALPHTYLIAGSVWLFGESEWAFRLPSAIIGSLTGMVAFFMGRRFLPPAYNLAFVATITLLPGMIEMSQTARMYVFLVTGLTVFAVCIFRWERNHRPTSLLFALLVWAVTLTFHQLAVFAALLFLFPGLSRRSWQLLAQGVIALLIAAWLFQSFQPYTSMLHPDGRVRPPPLERIERQSGLDLMIQEQNWLVAACAVIVLTLAVAGLLWSVRLRGWRSSAPLLLVGAGLLSVALLHYYIGGLLLAFGTVAWLRARHLPNPWLLGALSLAVAVASVQMAVLHASGVSSIRKLIGAVVGQPSVWPALRFLTYSPVAALAYSTVAAIALARFTRGKPLPDHFLFFAMAVLAPLFTLGFFEWSVPPRYASGQLPAFLLCVYAAVMYLLQEVAPERGYLLRPKTTLALLAIISLALINPIELARTVNPGYDTHPDHKGAAEFIKRLDLGPDAIVIAEDVLQQTYYLGHVDYWLRQIDDAHRFAMMRAGRLVDNYTATPILGTGDDLAAVFADSGERDVYVISNAESYVNGGWLFRDRGIQQVLDSSPLEVVYEGRDGKTTVWKLRN